MNKIETSVDGHVLLIGFNRPDKYNAFDLEMFQQLAQAYTELENNPELRCALVYAEGNHFCAGLELDKWASVFASGQFADVIGDELIDPLGTLPGRQVTKPVVMAVHGICFTIGIELMLATDIRVAAATTRFGQIEVKRGIYPVGGATVRWIQESGWSNAMRYLLTGDEFDGQEAFRIGLVQDVVDDQVKIHGLNLAKRIAAQAPLGVYASLKSARMARTEGEPTAFAQLMPDLQPIMASEDATEGVASFVERRAACFKGR